MTIKKKGKKKINQAKLKELIKNVGKEKKRQKEKHLAKSKDIISDWPILKKT